MIKQVSMIPQRFTQLDIQHMVQSWSQPTSLEDPFLQRITLLKYTQHQLDNHLA
jgi:hypothetical protein